MIKKALPQSGVRIRKHRFNPTVLWTVGLNHFGHPHWFFCGDSRRFFAALLCVTQEKATMKRRKKPCAGSVFSCEDEACGRALFITLSALSIFRRNNLCWALIRFFGRTHAPSPPPAAPSSTMFPAGYLPMCSCRKDFRSHQLRAQVRG